jgi:hypothetical protein
LKPRRSKGAPPGFFFPYSLKLRGQRVQKAKYASSKADANLFRRQLERLEDATATGIAGIKDITVSGERSCSPRKMASTSADLLEAAIPSSSYLSAGVHLPSFPFRCSLMSDN